MSEGKIVSWLKQPGDEVKKGEAVLVVESDKADMDVECFHSGTLATVLLPAGSSAPVGETLALVAETAAEVEEAKARGNTAASQPPAESTPPPAVEAPPAAEEPVTPADGAPAEAPAAPASGGRIIASPRAKALAKRLGIALESLQGSGPHGRIVANDVEQAAGQPLSPSALVEEGPPQAITAAPAPSGGPALTPQVSQVNGAVAAAAPAPPLAKAAPGQAAAFTTAQQAVNRNMTASLDAPCFQVGYTITTDPLEALYKQVKPRGVTMTALLVKAVAVTLAGHPQLNSAYTPEGMRFGAGIHVAVAVAMEDGGLITPVLRDAERTDLYSLSRTWADLVKRSRSKQLQPEDYSGGTFTLSNLGMFGVDRFSAILPPGTGAILAVAASRPVVAVTGGNAMAIQRQMQVNLTADHRVIYGTHAAAFLKDLAKLLEGRPESLAL